MDPPAWVQVHEQHIPVHPRCRLHTAFSWCGSFSWVLGFFWEDFFCLLAFARRSAGGLGGSCRPPPPPRHRPGRSSGGPENRVFGGSIIPLLAPSGIGAKERVSHPSSPSQNPNRWRSIAHFLVVMRFDSPSCTSAPIFSLSVKSQARNKRSNGEENINKNLRRSPPLLSCSSLPESVSKPGPEFTLLCFECRLDFFLGKSDHRQKDVEDNKGKRN